MKNMKLKQILNEIENVINFKITLFTSRGLKETEYAMNINDMTEWVNDEISRYSYQLNNSIKNYNDNAKTDKLYKKSAIAHKQKKDIIGYKQSIKNLQLLKNKYSIQ